MPLSLRSRAAGLLAARLRADERVAGAFNRSQLRRHQRDPIELPADFLLQHRRQLMAVAGSQRLEPFETISPKRVVVLDALANEQALDPIGMLLLRAACRARARSAGVDPRRCRLSAGELTIRRRPLSPRCGACGPRLLARVVSHCFPSGPCRLAVDDAPGWAASLHALSVEHQRDVVDRLKHEPSDKSAKPPIDRLPGREIIGSIRHPPPERAM